MGYISDLLSGKKIDEEANRLATQFIKRMPKERVSDSKRFNAEVSILLGHVMGYQRQAKLGVFGKSRLANTFQWTLVESGYEQALAKELGQKLARSMAADKGDAKADAKADMKADSKADSKADHKVNAKAGK